MTKHDNPPAFPVPNDANVNGQEGMTLRDWFAGQALGGVLAGGFADSIPYSDPGMEHETADIAYRIADAMLATRRAAITKATPEDRS